MYKHALKLSAQTIGGSQERKAQIEIQTACDSKLTFCKVNLDADHSPLESENNKWTLNAEAQVLRPESVSSVELLEQLRGRNQKFVAEARAQWGSHTKQKLRIRIQGVQAQKPQWRKIEEKESRNNKYYKRQTSFLNKYDMESEYKLQMSAQNMFQRAFEYVKAYYYWNTQVKQLDEDNNNNNLLQYSNGQQGNVQTSIVIDPITQKHANLTVKTQEEVVRIVSLELPGQFRPFPMVRPSEKSTHSMQQLFARWTVSNRAECTVDGRRVNTFDDVDYKAPISKCYSVLAKDCSSEEPQFVVMLKALDNQSREKKVKVITPDKSIECQTKNAGSYNNKKEENRYKPQKLQCKINGHTVDEHNNEIEDQTVE
jgi:hypothetical protein